MKFIFILVLTFIIPFKEIISQTIVYTLDKKKIELGDSVLLKWESNGIDEVFLGSKSYNTMSLSGQIYLKPTKRTSYNLKAIKKKKTFNNYFTVEVYSPEIIDFHSDRSEINFGDSVTFYWKVKNSKELFLNGTLHSLIGKDSIKLRINSIDTIQTVALIAKGDFNSDTSFVTIKVKSNKYFGAYEFTFPDVWTGIWWNFDRAEKVMIDEQLVPNKGYSQFYLKHTKKFRLLAFYKDHTDTLYKTIVVKEMKEVRDVDIPKLLKLVNETRSQGRYCGNLYCPSVEPLKWNETLEKAAQIHSEYMYLSKNYSHNGHNGISLEEKFERIGIPFFNNFIGENIANGQENEVVVITRWLLSPGHCENIMNGNFKYFAVAKKNSYWTQVFSKTVIIEDFNPTMDGLKEVHLNFKE